jgi:multiple sugar transport system substrate-binding protein
MKRLVCMSVGLLVLLGLPLWADTEITWMNYAQPQEKAIFQKLIAKFEASHPGITVKFISTTQDQFGAKIQAAMASNTLPDVFYVGPADVRTYVDNKKLLDLTPYVTAAKDIDVKGIWENALKKYRYDGKVIGQGSQWALPKDQGPFAFGYNKTMFKKAGIPLPSKDKPYTWDQFIEVAKKLTKDTNGDGKLDQWGTGLNVRWSFIQFAWGNGADFLDASQTKVTITDPKFTEALQFFADMTLKYGITPSMGEAQSMDTYQRWLKGQIAFFPIAPWDLAAFKDLSFDYDLIPWPVHNDGNKSATWVGSVGYGVAANSKNPKEAAELALYLSGDAEAAKTMVDLDLQIPNISSLKDAYVNKPGKPENREEYIKIISDYGRGWPADYTYNSVWFDEFWPNIQRVLDGKQTAVEYCKVEEPKMQKLLDKANAKMKK